MKKMFNKVIIVFGVMLLLCSCDSKKAEQYDISGKTFYDTVNEYDPIEFSNAWFGKDGSFVMTDYFFDGYYEINGNWSIKENVVTVDVTNTGVGDFKKILFEITDNDNIVLRTALAGSQNNHIFTTTKPTPSVKPVEDNSTNSNNNNNSTIKFVHEPSDMTSEQYLPSVVFDAHGQFVFTENLFAGMGDISGTYELTGNGYLCHVEKIFSGFAGDDVTVIEFEYLDDNTLELKTDICMSLKGDKFYIAQ